MQNPTCNIYIMNFLKALLFLWCFTWPVLSCAQSEIIAPRMAMDGIWDIEDEGNEKYTALSLAISHQFTGIGHRSQGNPIYGAGVWKLSGENFWRGAGGTLKRAEDGSITMSHGQFEYCMCKTVDYAVKPTSDPDVMTGTWIFKGKGDYKASGKSIWRRRPPLQIDSISIYAHGQTRHKTRPSAGPLKIEQRFTRGDIRVTIKGKRLAGGHNLGMDLEGDALKIRDQRWLCKNGDRRDSWPRCGNEQTLGDGVSGISFVIRSSKTMEPGLRTIWLDGQAIPLEVVTEPVKPPEVAEILLMDLEGNPIPEDLVSYGQKFLLHVLYEDVPAKPPENLKLNWEEGTYSVVDLFPTEEKTRFTSQPLSYGFDEQAVLEQEEPEL